MLLTDPMHRQGMDTTSDKLCIFVNIRAMEKVDCLDVKELFLDL